MKVRLLKIVLFLLQGALFIPLYIFIGCTGEYDDGNNVRVCDKSLTIDSLVNIGLPVMMIQTVDNIVPSFDYVLPPEGGMGSSITNANKVPASIKILSTGGGHYLRFWPLCRRANWGKN